MTGTCSECGQPLPDGSGVGLVVDRIHVACLKPGPNPHAIDNAALKVRLLAELAAATPSTEDHDNKRAICKRMGYAV